MAESVPLKDIETNKASKQCRYFKMKILNSNDSNEINNVVHDDFDEKSIVFSDKSKNYVYLHQNVGIHVVEKSIKETTNKSLPWVHIAISNAKRNLLGVYHKKKSKYLQLYLDEFCHKNNYRCLEDSLLDRLAIAMADNYWHNKD